MSTTELVKLEPSGNQLAPLSSSEVMEQVKLIQEVMKGVMRDKEHYGTIPGCGTKPSLFKAGAEKLCMTFRLVTEYDIRQIERKNDHRDYEVRCKLKSFLGQLLGEGVGICSTMESKYRYRSAEPVVTDKPVPRGFWDMRNANPVEAQKLIGGDGFTYKKVGSAWFIAKGSSEKVENENIADVYNTVLKMAKKRAMVDAVEVIKNEKPIMEGQRMKDQSESRDADEIPMEWDEKGKSKMAKGKKDTFENVELAGDWEDVICLVGSGTGKRLGSLDSQTLELLQKTYSVKKDNEGNYDTKALTMRLALDASRRGPSKGAK